MHTATSTPIPASPASFTHLLHGADPAPAHWPAPRFDAAALLASRRAAASLATVRAMVAECVAMCPEVST